MSTIEATESKGPGTRYDESVKQRAFQVYAYRAGRRVQETVHILAEMGDEIAPSTIYLWRQEHEWDHLLALEEAKKQEELVRGFASKLRTAAPDAVQYLADVSQGKVAGDPLRIRAAQILATENRHLVVALEREIDRERERNGRQPTKLPDLSELTTEELMALAGN